MEPSYEEESVKMVLHAVRRRLKAFPHLNRKGDLTALLKRALNEENPALSELNEKSKEALTVLLNSVYRKVWNARATLEIATPSYYQSYLDDPSAPREVQKVMKSLLEGEIVTSEASKFLGKVIESYEIGIVRLGYTHDDEIDAFVPTSSYLKGKR